MRAEVTVFQASKGMLHGCISGVLGVYWEYIRGVVGCIKGVLRVY